MTDPDDRFDDDDLAELRHLVARAQPEDVEWQAPPAGLWDRIAAAVNDEARYRTTRPGRRSCR